MSKKLLTIFGATGNQGGSVISNLLAHPDLASKYSIRAVTRDVNKPAAQALKSKGCEVVAADMGNTESLKHAINGAYGVYALTNYWEYMNKDTEISQGKAIADACIEFGVQHLIWSSLPNTYKLTDGKLPNIDHFDSKAEVETYIETHKSKGKNGGLWASYFMPAFFMSNFVSFINPGQDGVPTLAMPMAPDAHFALIDIQVDTGKYVLGALEAGKRADGVQIQAASDWTTPAGIAETFTKYGGMEVKFVQIPRDVFKGFLAPKMGDFGAEELTQNMELIGDYSYYGKGTEKKQAESDKWLLKGSKKVSFRDFVEKGKPWNFGGQ